MMRKHLVQTELQGHSTDDLPDQCASNLHRSVMKNEERQGQQRLRDRTLIDNLGKCD